MATRGIGNAIVTVMAGLAIVKDLPEISKRLGEKIKDVKSAGKKLKDFTETFTKKIQDLDLENIKNVFSKLDADTQKKLLKDIENFTESDLLELENNIGLLDEYKKLSKLSDAEIQSKLPDWLQKIKDGQKFNKERHAFYPYNEIYLEKPAGVGGKGKYVVLDFYVDGKEIVSRKYTQFSEITEETGLNYLRELRNKYPTKSKIARVDSNIKGKNSGLKGIDMIEGELFLEVPVQNGKIPENILKFADENFIKIRDINGHIYN